MMLKKLTIVLVVLFASTNLLMAQVVDPLDPNTDPEAYAQWKLENFGDGTNAAGQSASDKSAAPDYRKSSGLLIPYPGSGGWSVLAANDDGSTGQLALGFNFDFYGSTRSNVYVNNNGNVSFGSSFFSFSPTGFPSSQFVMIAPFWGDVDTRGGSGRAYYKQDTYNGDPVFVAHWEKVGYYSQNIDKLNTFQVVLSPAGVLPGGNNVCFGYGDMGWTTGDASGGTGGFGGSPATVGANEGNGTDFFQYGRFDKDGTDYDGPGGSTDGVDHLDGQQICFNTGTGTNNIPPIAQGVPSSPISVEAGSTVNGSFNFTSPETAQTTTVAVTGEPSNFTTNTTPGNLATVNFSFAPTAAQVGTYSVLFEGADNGTPVQSTIVELIFEVESSPSPTVITDPATDIQATEARLNGRVNPQGVQTEVKFEYFPTGEPSHIERIEAQESPLSGTEEQAVSLLLEELQPETGYQFRVFAENSLGSARGEYLTFTTGATPPLIQTNPATNVEATAAQLNGIVDPKGEETTVEFEYYPSASPSQAVTIPAVESPLMGEGEQSVSVSPDNLEPDTEYTFFARATNSSGSATGDPLTFTTEGAPPEFTQIDPFSVNEAAPEGDPVGDVDANDGAGGATDDGVSYTITDGNDPDADGVPAFAINSGDGRIEVANAGEVDFEARQQFALEIVADNGVSTTTATADITVDDVPPPTATTGSVTDVSSVAATLQGTANPNGAETTITFAYHPEGAPGKVQTAPAEESPLTGAGAAEVSARVEGLAPGTDYVFRVAATSTEGEKRGDDQPFATPPAVPVAQADPAVDVDTTSAGLRGTVDPGGAETTVQFEYYPQGAPSQSQIVAAAESPLTGNGSQSVSAPVTGLDSNTGYTFILRADNSAGNIASNERDFKTDSFPPRVEVGPLTEEITVSGVSIRAQVNPRGADTEVKFKYFPAAQPAQVQVVEAETLLSGGVQEITAPIASLRPSTEYDVRVVATSVGGADSSQATFTTEVLRVEAAAEPSEPRRGTAAVVEATAPAGFAPSERRLFWRPGGAPGYQSVPMVAVGGGGLSEERTYAAEIPAAGVTARGLEYYVRLVEERAGGPDLVATVPETPPGGDPAEDPARAPRQLRVQVDSIAPGIALPEGAYRMISAPLALEDPRAVAALRDDFGAPDRTAWRLLRWDAAAEGYKEVTLPAGEGGAPEAELRPGQAYWLIAREGGTFDVEGARSVAGTPVTLELPPGWTQLATPRAYPVAWSDIEGTALTDASSPLTYLPAASDSAGEASGDAFATADVLQPWTGYWVYNPQAGPIELTVPNRAVEGVGPLAASGGSGAGPAGASPAGAGEDWTERLFGRTVDYGIEVVGWAVPKDSRGSPTRAAVAWGEGGRAAAGAEDAFLPPPIGEHLRLSVVETAAATGAPVRLAGSLRPPGQEGYAWDLELRASPGRLATAPGGRLQVDLELRASAGSSAPPPGFERRLIDRASGRELVASANGRARVALTPEAPVRRLRLIVGTAAYAEEAARAVAPARTALGAAYPNPSAGAVSVEYELAGAGPVEMAVYDVLGRRVRTLVTGRQAAGKHAAQWDGRSASGGPVASGLYLVRLRAGGSAYTRPVTIVR